MNNTEEMTGNSRSPAKILLDVFNSLYATQLRSYQRLAWENAYRDPGGTLQAAKIYARKALIDLFSNAEIVNHARALLEDGEWSPLEEQQLKIIVEKSVNHPLNAKECHHLFELETRLAGLYARKVETSADPELDGWRCRKILEDELDLDVRRRAWTASVSVSADLADVMNRLVLSRNSHARTQGFSDFSELNRSQNANTAAGFERLLEDGLSGSADAFLRSKTWLKERLTARFGEKLDGPAIPAHLFPDAFGQAWGKMLPVCSELDRSLKDKSPEWILATAAGFWRDIGLPPLDSDFWSNSNFVADGPGQYSGATSWDMDLSGDARIASPISCDSYGYGALHHEFGHVHHYRAYASENVPPVLRNSAAPALHEAIADLGRMASFDARYLARHSLVPPPGRRDLRNWALFEWLYQGLPLFRWAAGTVRRFEDGVYSRELPVREWQSFWSELRLAYQYVSTPNGGPSFRADPLAVPHLLFRPFHYRHYGLAVLLKYQIHEFFCEQILKEDPLCADWTNRPELGVFLMKLMSPGQIYTLDELFQRTLSQRPSAAPFIRRCNAMIGIIEDNSCGT